MPYIYSDSIHNRWHCKYHFQFYSTNYSSYSKNYLWYYWGITTDFPDYDSHRLYIKMV